MTDVLHTDILTRPTQIAIKPMILDAAYEDPDAVVEAIFRTGPHRNLYAAEGLAQGDHPPCFRGYWSERPGSIQSQDLLPFKNNPIFIEAAKIAYNAKVVRPERIIVNLNIPGPAQPAHMDFPTLRGIGSRPTWLTVIMGVSKLFLPWEVQIASALTWFYKGEGGEFRFWPDGPDKPATEVKGPFWNKGLVCDNEYTFHQACGTGRRDQYLPAGTVSQECTLGWTGSAWELCDQGRPVLTYPFDEVRLLTLWKGHVFADERAAQVFDEHLDDLDHGKIVKIFAADLRKKGYRFDEPSDPLNDPAWKQLLVGAYPLPPAPADHQPIIR